MVPWLNVGRAADQRGDDVLLNAGVKFHPDQQTGGRMNGWTDGLMVGWTDGQTDGQTEPLIEMQEHI